jgi:MoxR-like ATPase
MGTVSQLTTHARAELSKVIIGQQQLLDELLLVVLCEGHALIEGVPGVAKTLAAKSLARMLQLQFQRVQCTPDLMPADVLGANVYNMSKAEFVQHRGPIFTDLLLVDEINRMPPRTQAALLEAMEERQVTMDGARHALSRNFAVLATQNPVEFEGTYPLPEAQLDRFLMKIRVEYPTSEQEMQILGAYQQGFDARDLETVGLVQVSPEMLTQARNELRQVKVEPSLFKYITALARRTREWPAIALGASPRAAIALMLVSKAVAAMEDRDYVVPDDVKQAALPVLRHRIVLRPEADLEGVTADQAIRDVIAAVELPK